MTAFIRASILALSVFGGIAAASAAPAHGPYAKVFFEKLARSGS